MANASGVKEIKASYTSEVIVKKSKFLGFLFPCPNAAELKVQRDKYRAEHSKARHVVYAGVFGASASEFSQTDDGEPKGTAGSRMLNILKGSGLTNVGLIIVRYFGGTLLGVGGLGKAYSDCTKKVVELALKG